MKYTQQKIIAMLSKTVLNNVAPSTLLKVVNQTTLLPLIWPKKILFHDVDNYIQCGWHNIVQSCGTAGSQSVTISLGDFQLITQAQSPKSYKQVVET